MALPFFVFARLRALLELIPTIQKYKGWFFMPRPAITKEETIEIIKLYNDGLKIQEIADRFDRDPSTIISLLKRNGINYKRKFPKLYDKNDNYFDSIDTEAKAYFLGLICADGGIHKNQLKINLQTRDKHILEKFSIEIFGNMNHLVTRTPLSKDGYNRQDQTMFRVCSKHMIETLKSYNIGERKSFTLGFPDCVPQHLIRHFIRGYFDGDGSISKYTNRNSDKPSFCFNIICTPNFGKSLNEIILKEIGVKLQYVFDHRYSQKMVYCKTSGTHKPNAVYQWLYKDATIYLKRKFEKYIEFQKHVTNSTRGRNRHSHPPVIESMLPQAA